MTCSNKLLISLYLFVVIVIWLSRRYLQSFSNDLTLIQIAISADCEFEQKSI